MNTSLCQENASSCSVTVIITCYNGESTIARAIQSARRQSHRNLEIIIVDDGSTDSSSQVIKKEIHDEPRAKLITKSNGGLGSARHEGASQSSGEFLTFLDADDEYDVRKVQDQLSAFNDDEKSIVFTGATIQSAGKTRRRHTSGSTTCITDDYCSGKNLPAANASMMLRRSDYFSWGGFLPEMRRNCEENLFLRVVAHEGTFYIKETPSYIVNESPDSNRKNYIGKLDFYIKNIKLATTLIHEDPKSSKTRIKNYATTFTRNLTISSTKWPFRYRLRLGLAILTTKSPISLTHKIFFAVICSNPITIPQTAWEALKNNRAQT